MVLLAPQSPIDGYDTTLFRVHMAQHLLLTMVAAPLLLLAAPVTLLSRAARPRRRDADPAGAPLATGAAPYPVVAWTVFAAVTWASHFSACSMRPSTIPWSTTPSTPCSSAPRSCSGGRRGRRPCAAPPAALVRVGYLAVGMPLNTFLALAIFSATDGAVSPLRDAPGRGLGPAAARGPGSGPAASCGWRATSCSSRAGVAVRGLAAGRGGRRSPRRSIDWIAAEGPARSQARVHEPHPPPG